MYCSLTACALLIAMKYLPWCFFAVSIIPSGRRRGQAAVCFQFPRCLLYTSRNDARGVGQNPLVAVSDCIDGAYEMLNANAPFFTQRLTEKTGFDCTNGNDANLFTDGDGKTYISVCNFGGIYAYEIDLPSCQLQGEPIRIVEPSLDGWDTKNEGDVYKRQVILVTHDMDIARRADVVITLENGEIVSIDPIAPIVSGSTD